jgi:hypothetical protein
MNSRSNRRFGRRVLVLSGFALALGPGFATAAAAQNQSTPRGWNYEIRDGKRVPRTPGNRVSNPDGSWREEQRQGNCVTVKERTKTGEYKETRQCNPS